MESNMVTTGLELPGYRIVKSVAVVRGITVRSAGVAGNFIAGLQAMFKGRVGRFTELCETARAEAFTLMMADAIKLGANAIIAARYDANEVMAGITEVLAYGTAVVVERIDGA